MKLKPYVIASFSLVSICYVVYLMFLLIENGFPKGFTEFGTLGDAFGTLNSLFSGLGFAGIAVTLLFQQQQFKTQEKENYQQDLRYQNDQYENTLHRYLDLYKQVLSEVSLTDETLRFEGRDILYSSIKNAMESIRVHSTTFYPRQIRHRTAKGTLTEEDQEIIQFILYEHHRLIKSNIAWQGRLLQTAHLLFRHLEEKVPAGYDINSARELVMSQLTHIECHYFFLICLSSKSYSDMAKYMSKSIFLVKHNKFKMSDIDRDLFEYVYKVNLKKETVLNTAFLDMSVVKNFRKRKKLIQARYRMMIHNDTNKE